MAAYATAAATLTGRGEAASIPTAVATADLFPLLGVAPIQGRVLLSRTTRAAPHGRP